MCARPSPSWAPPWTCPTCYGRAIASQLDAAGHRHWRFPRCRRRHRRHQRRPRSPFHRGGSRRAARIFREGRWRRSVAGSGTATDRHRVGSTSMISSSSPARALFCRRRHRAPPGAVRRQVRPAQFAKDFRLCSVAAAAMARRAGAGRLESARTARTSGRAGTALRITPGRESGDGPARPAQDRAAGRSCGGAQPRGLPVCGGARRQPVSSSRFGPCGLRRGPPAPDRRDCDKACRTRHSVRTAPACWRRCRDGALGGLKHADGRRDAFAAKRPRLGAADK